MACPPRLCPCPQEGDGRGRLSRGHLSHLRGVGGSPLCAGSRSAALGRPLCSQTISALKGKVSELQWSVMNQEMQVKSLESEKQELQEQLALQRK